MEPWYKVATPRKEVREGRSFNPDEFAIALEQVVAGRGPEDYRDPAQFFARTCFTRALREHTGMGFIETLWEDSSLDGLGAMTGAWWCYEEAGRRGLPVEDLELMQEIVRYNEIDCRVLMDVMGFLRGKC